jgi:glycosyltransferase involved in cell wall biosynthesis
MRIALVHDWLNGMRGGEKVLETLCELYPDATLFTLIYEPDKVSPILRKMNVISHPVLSKLPLAKSHYRYYLPLFPHFIEQFDLTGYDLVISTSHCVAKGVIIPPEAFHLCYCFTPMRYAWDQYHQYFPANKKGICSVLIPFIMTHLRNWDQKTADRVDQFVAISENISRKIYKYYRRESTILYPPVDTDFFYPEDCTIEDFYLIVSALVPYKRIDIAIQAFNELNLPLKIVGKGPEMAQLAAKARSNVAFLGWQDDLAIRALYSRCQALIFPGEEDFGIVPLEAMSCGRPVIAYAKGGALETVKEGINGIFFYNQTADSLIEAIKNFKTSYFSEKIIRESISNFSRELFKENFKQLVDQYYNEWVSNGKTKSVEYCFPEYK